MEVFIIYAALSIGNLTTFFEFKGKDFVNMQECNNFYKEYKEPIELSLQEHINETHPEYIVSYIGCSTRSKFIAKSTDT